MLHVTLANLRAHKRRLVATFAAVALGVAFLAGVLIQTSTLQQGFDDQTYADLGINFSF